MANYCPNCGVSVDPSAQFCSSCGAALNGSAGATYQNNTGNNMASAAVGALGTLVAVSLLGGMTRQLYYYGGRYFLDPYCRRPFLSPHLIMGGHRPIGRPPMGGMHGPGGPHGGFGGPHGGPHGGGPGGHGGHR